MTLVIDTSKTSWIKIKLKEGRETIVEDSVEAKLKQSEKLLSLISQTLKKGKLKLSDISEIRVVATGETFTGLRIGVVTANTLGYALGVPVRAVNSSGKEEKEQIIEEKDIQIVSPKYNKPPNIDIKSL